MNLLLMPEAAPGKLPSMNQETIASRKLRAISQGQADAVARRLGVHRNSVYAWRAGRLTPHPRHRELLYDVYQIAPIDWFTPAP